MPSYRSLATSVICFTFVINMIFTINGLSTKDTKISTTRNSNRVNICSYYSASYSLQQRQKSKASVQQYSYMTDTEIQNFLLTKKYFFSSYTVLITMPHIIAVAVLLVLIGPLICCCAWPEKYPICKKWRKPDEEMYNRYELKCPAYFSIAFYIIVCVGALVALIQATVIVRKFNDVGCKNAAIFDDFLYGRMSSSVDGRFFIGLEPFRNQITTFNNSKISTFFSDSSNSLSTADQVRTKQSLVQTAIETTYSSYTNSVYSNAFSAGGSTYYDVNSAFKTMYMGPSSDSSKMLGIVKSKLTIIFNQINAVLDNMVSAWQTLQTTTQSTVQSQITAFSLSAIDIKSKLDTNLNDVGDIFNKNKLYNQLYGMLSAYYGMVFGFALLGFIASILITFCSVVRTRLIMYFTCGFLVFFAFIGFTFLIYLTFMYPQMNQVCSYVDKKLSSGAQTKIMLQKMGYTDFADKISSCMSDGSGKMIDTINAPFLTSFDKINIIAQGTLTFNDKILSFTQSNIDEPFTTVYSTLAKVKNALVWDINDAAAISHVDKVFSKSYTLGATCNAVAVNGDSWMPSFSLYTCPAGKSKMSACSDLSLQTTCPLGCYEILNEFESPSGDPSYTTTLATRYGGASCNYYQYITNIHNNWDIVRQNKMDTVNGSIGSLKIIVDNYATKVSSVKAAVNSFKTTLEANLNSMTNLTSGSFNGMDCRVIGQSIWQFRDAYCIGLVESYKYNIICLCLICYGSLFLACFVTCTGTRHFKHLQKMQTNVGYTGTLISLSDTTIIDK